METSTQPLTTENDITNTELDGSVQIFLATVKVISRSYTLVLIFASFVCNPLTQIVLSRKAFRDNSVSIYLRFLSIIDFAAVVLGLGVSFLDRTFHVDVMHTSTACKIVSFLISVLVSCSSWTLVAVGLERVQSILQPHRSGTLCTICTPKRTITVIVIVIFALYSPTLLVFGEYDFFDTNMNTTLTYTCVFSPDYEVLPNIYYAIDCSLFAYIPISFLITFNILIVYGIMRSRKRLLKFKQETTTTSGKPKTSSRVSHLTTAAFKREASLTKMLVGVNLIFICCNFPICISSFVYDGHDRAQQAIAWAVTDLFLVFMFTNNSLNFLLYCITGSKFRQEAKLVFWDILTLRGCRRNRFTK